MRFVFTILLFLLLAPRAWAGLDLDEGLFTDPALGVRLRIPEGWSASTQTGYPGLLLMLHASSYRSRIMLAAADLPRGKSFADFVAGTVAGLRALGMTVYRSQQTNLQGRTVWELLALASHDVEVRQVALVQGNRIFTLTLAGPKLEMARLQADLQQTLAGLTLN